MAFSVEALQKLSKQVEGKAIVKIEDCNNMDDWLSFTFADGTELRFRYDWIYEFEMISKDGKVMGEER
jgi:hypothetical protein